MTETCLEMIGVTFVYQRQPVIRDVSYRFACGRLYGLLGPNGCGKSTLMDLMAGYRKPEQGRVRLFGDDVYGLSKDKLSRMVAMVTQNFYIRFPYPVSDVVMMGRYPHISRFAAPDVLDYQVVDQAMELTDIKRFENRMITELSGGERQRAVFARALAQQTGLLLLDEATSNLDIRHTLRLLSVLRRKVREEGMTVIAVFQDINLAARYCDELLFMKTGALVAGGPCKTVLTPLLLQEVFAVQAEVRMESRYQAPQAVFLTEEGGA